MKVVILEEKYWREMRRDAVEQFLRKPFFKLYPASGGKYAFESWYQMEGTSEVLSI